MAELVEMQEKAQASKDNKTAAKSMTELEAEARKKVVKTYDEMFRRMGQLDRDDSVLLCKCHC
jgi:carboxyl-terminal processing protease